MNGGGDEMMMMVGNIYIKKLLFDSLLVIREC